MNDSADTICAISTPPGRSGIAVVRMSGPQSLSILYRIFHASPSRKQLPPRQAVLGRIVNPDEGFEVDEVVATTFPAPNSYTREDVVEISLHGSPVLIAAVLDCLCSQGARLAKPGEFTMRAFLNGRIDLSQAEAIGDIIDATTLYQAQVAGRQRSGILARNLKPVKEELVEVIVHLESAVEFVEEDLPLNSREKSIERIGRIHRKIQDWIRSYRQGKVVKEGFRMAVVGRPNVGKSSVFNALLAQNRSIVNEMPGTTRDLISEYTNLEGIPVSLQDTAGIHDSADHVEKLGMDRSLRAMVDADAILFVMDQSQRLSKQDEALKQKLEDLSCIVVMNKSDLASKWSSEEKAEWAGSRPYVDVSAKTGSGIAGLRRTILSRITGGDGVSLEGILVTNLRHYQNLDAAGRSLLNAISALKEGLSEEFALVDLHRALNELGAITGEVSVDDLLGEIFSRFCIGK